MNEWAKTYRRIHNGCKPLLGYSLQQESGDAARASPRLANPQLSSGKGKSAVGLLCLPATRRKLDLLSKILSIRRKSGPLQQLEPSRDQSN